MLCPRCRTIQIVEKHSEKHGLKLDLCPQCRGIWFDKGELERMLAVAVKKLKAPISADTRGLECPKCGGALYNFDYPGTKIAVDMCKKCGGIWLDGGEFNKIKAVRKTLQQTGGEKKGVLARILSPFKSKDKG